MAGVMGFGVSLSALVKLCAFLTVWRTPEETSDYLWQTYRIKRNARRLAQLRASGEGPPFFRDGHVVRYRSDLTDEWALTHLGEALSSTSEENARKETAV
jgi:hypothetical protein